MIPENRETIVKSIRQFFLLANRREVQWCHWKSNAEILDSISGKNDLDLLFHKKDVMYVEEIMEKIRALKCSAVKQKRYTDIDDYLVLLIQQVELWFIFMFIMNYV
jgi:hypothetical protein